MTVSKVLITPVGMSCNLRCSYCYNGPGAGPKRRNAVISDSIQERLYEGLVECGAPKVTVIWHGGEPTLAGIDFFRRSVQAQEALRQTGRIVHNCIQTNGTRITDAWCDFFAEHDFRPSLSLDGPRALHDRHRRDSASQGTYSRVMETVERLRRHEINFGLLVVVTRETLPLVDQLFDWIVENRFAHLDLLPCYEPLREGGISERTPTNEELARFFIALFDRWWAHDDSGIRIRMFRDVLRTEMGSHARICSWRGGCSWVMSVDEHGFVFPCARFHGYPITNLGQLTSATLQQIFASEKAADIRARMESGQTECLECSWLRACGGGCPFSRYAAGGSFSSGYIYCEMRKRLFAHIHERCEATRRTRERGRC